MLTNLGGQPFLSCSRAQLEMKAARMWRLAAAQGHSDAQFSLGCLYFLRGHGVMAQGCIVRNLTGSNPRFRPRARGAGFQSLTFRDVN